MAVQVPVKVALPAAAALFAYLDAKFHISYDLNLFLSFITVALRGRIREKQDRLNLFYVLEEWAQSSTHKDRNFLLFAGRSWTYGQTYEKVLKYGAWIKRKFGIKKDEVVAMDFMNSDTFIFVWFGLWAIGAKPAFINYNLTEKPLVHCLKTSSSRVVLVDPRVKDNFHEAVIKELQGPGFLENGGGMKVCFLDDTTLDEIEATPPKREPDSARGGQQIAGMAILIYTSGTTGLPKPAIVSWSKAGLAPRFVGKWLPLETDDIMYTCMPIYHSSAALLCLAAVLNAGCTVSIGEKFHRSKFWDEVRATDATVIQYVGETCRYLLAAPPSPLDREHKVRKAFGNGLRPDVWPKFKERFGIDKIIEFYGATEGPGALWAQSRNSFLEGAVGLIGPVGSFLMGSRATVLTFDFETNLPARDPRTGFCTRAPPNTPGELVFRLDEKDINAQFQGYYKNNKATSSKIMRDVLRKGDAYFSTGDVLRCDHDGRWFFADRIGDTFRWKSENVSTAEVAHVVGAVPAIDEANVYGVELPAHDGRAGCAALCLAENHFGSNAEKSSPQKLDALLADILTKSRAQLPRYAVPVFVRVLSPETAERNRTGTNKQQKHVLRSQGVDPARIAKDAPGDQLFWLQPGKNAYQRFGQDDFDGVKAGMIKL